MGHTESYYTDNYDWITLTLQENVYFILLFSAKFRSYKELYSMISK